MTKLKFVVSLFVLSCTLGASSLIFSGDDKPSGDEDAIRKATQMLLSDDPAVRARGSEMMRQHYSQQVAALKELIRDKDNFMHHTKSVEASIGLLGEMRAVEAVDLLIDVIRYPECAHPDAKSVEEIACTLRSRRGRGSLSTGFGPIKDEYPAVRALIRIGEPCLDKVIERIANQNSTGARDPLVVVLKGLKPHAPVRKRIEDAITAASGHRRENLEQALKFLDQPTPTLEDMLRELLAESAPRGGNSPATKRVTLTATLPKRLIANETWPTTIRLHNGSEKRVTIFLRETAIDVLVEARDADGEYLERTEFGRQHLPGQIVHRGGKRIFIDNVYSNMPKYLDPGESHEWKIELGKCFEFTPGEYTVEMSLSVEKVGKVTHKVKIQVLPAKE